MTDFVIRPAISSSGAAQSFRRFAARLRRLLYREMIADETYRALDELPDNLLRDIGLARNEIPFVAGALASGYRGDALERTAGVRGSAARQLPHVVFNSR